MREMDNILKYNWINWVIKWDGLSLGRLVQVGEKIRFTDSDAWIGLHLPSSSMPHIQVRNSIMTKIIFHLLYILLRDCIPNSLQQTDKQNNRKK